MTLKSTPFRSFCKAEHQRVIDMLYEVNVETLKAAPWEIYKCWMNYPKPYRQGQGPQEVGRTTQGATNRDDNYVFQWNWDAVTWILPPNTQAF
jgi:hypothetical protein